MGFAKRPRDLVKEMKVSELKEMIRNLRIKCPSGARKAVMATLIIRHMRPEVIRNNYGGFSVTPAQSRRIRKANNRAKGIKR